MKLSPSPMKLRAAVNSFCRTCIYDKQSGCGSWRKQVLNCSAFSCPLFNVRPGAIQARGTSLSSQLLEKTAHSDVFLTDAERLGRKGNG